MKQAILGEVKRVDFDLYILADVKETDISIRDHGFYLEHDIGGHNDRQLLGRRHYAAYSVNRELLHDAIDRGGQAWSLVRCSAFARSPLRPAALRSASARSPNSLR